MITGVYSSAHMWRLVHSTDPLSSLPIPLLTGFLTSFSVHRCPTVSDSLISECSLIAQTEIEIMQDEEN